MLAQYPPVGFHFRVEFDLFDQETNDSRFQEVNGLSVELETEDFKEGGENRFVHKLPTRTKYSDLTLKRGMLIGSDLYEWCRQAIENFQFQPTNILITLLNDEHEPISAWYAVNAYPKQWSVSDFKAEENAIVVESMKFNYNYFNSIEI